MKALKDVLTEGKHEWSYFHRDVENSLWKAAPIDFKGISLYNIKYFDSRGEEVNAIQDYTGVIKRVAITFTGSNRAEFRFKSPTNSSFTAFEKWINNCKAFKELGVTVDKVRFNFCCGISVRFDDLPTCREFSLCGLKLYNAPLKTRMGTVYHGETDAFFFSNNSGTVTLTDVDFNSNFTLYVFNTGKADVTVKLDKTCKYLQSHGVICTDRNEYGVTFMRNPEDRDTILHLKRGSWGSEEEIVLEPGTNFAK